MRIHISDIVKKEVEEVELIGWIHARRDHGKLIFVDLRDRSGSAQVVLTSKIGGASDLRLEYLVRIKGMVQKRPPAMVNEKIPTGHHEISAKSLEILSVSEATPIPIDTDGYEVNEE